MTDDFPRRPMTADALREIERRVNEIASRLNRERLALKASLATPPARTEKLP